MNHPDKWKAGEAYIEFQTLKNRIHYINILSFNGGSDFNIHTENQGLTTPWILNPSAPGSLNNSLIIIKIPLIARFRILSTPVGHSRAPQG